MNTHEATTWTGIPSAALAAQIERLTLYWRVHLDTDGSPWQYYVDGNPVEPDDVDELALRLAKVSNGGPDPLADVADAVARCGWAGRLAEARRWLAGEVLDDAEVRDRQDTAEDAARALVLAADVRDEMVWFGGDTTTATFVVTEALAALQEAL